VFSISNCESARKAIDERSRSPEDRIRDAAHQPGVPAGAYRFVNREYFIITYRTDADALRAVIPAPLEMTEPVVKYEFIRMPDSTGFGDYTESGQVIPVSFRRERGGYVHAMYLNDHPPIAGGRELWGFPKKLRGRAAGREGHAARRADYGPVPVAGTMGYKHGAGPEPIGSRSPRRTTC
jgi:acetoacetate decarboxylase